MPRKSAQTHFHVCQNCHKMVEQVFQKGFCRTCLIQHFQGLQYIINSSHAARKSVKTDDSAR